MQEPLSRASGGQAGWRQKFSAGWHSIYIEGTLWLPDLSFVQNLDTVVVISQNTWSQRGLGATSVQICKGK